MVRITALGGSAPKSKPAKAKESAPASKAAESKAPETKSGTKADDDALPVLFTNAPAGAPDDLKKISGVGPVIEKKLNALGITHYSQVAAVTADDIAQVDEVLNFKGRIERDDWLAQAAKLANGEE